MGVPSETVLGTEFDTMNLPPRAVAAGALGAVTSVPRRSPRAAAAAGGAAQEANGGRRPGTGAAGAGEASQAGLAMQAACEGGLQCESMPDTEFDMPEWSEDECSDQEEELSLHLARVAGEARELAAALEPVQESPDASGGEPPTGLRG